MSKTQEPRFPSLISESLAEAFAGLRGLHERLAIDAARMEAAIRAMDAKIARALAEDEVGSPMSRVIACRTTLWAQHGWFASTWHTPLALVSRTAEALGTERHRRAEVMIAAHFESESAALIEDVLRSCPDRRAIVADAFDAHMAGRYTLSIPVFLTQADGIGSNFFQVQSIYTVSDDNFDRIRSKLEEEPPLLSIHSIYFLVGILTPLNASRRRRDRYPAALNRHTVIHGESTDYATKVNSLKAISWLHFVTGLVSEARQSQLGQPSG